jgi:hypothetical protein
MLAANSIKTPCRRTFALLIANAQFQSTSTNAAKQTRTTIRAVPFIVATCETTLSRIRSARRTFGSDAKELAKEILLLQEIEDTNEAHRGKLEIRKSNNKHMGYGVFALMDYPKDNFVVTGKPVKTQDYADSHTIQTGFDKHVLMNLPALMLNHRCNSANVKAVANPVGGYDFVALRDIKAGSEIQLDYETTELAMSEPSFDCKCGDPYCRRTLRGFKYNALDVLQNYGMEGVAEYLLERDPLTYLDQSQITKEDNENVDDKDDDIGTII